MNLAAALPSYNRFTLGKCLQISKILRFFSSVPLQIEEEKGNISDVTDDDIYSRGSIDDSVSNIDNEEDFYVENHKLLTEISYFDVLRSDKSISGAGLEARVPFSDKDFVQYVMNVFSELNHNRIFIEGHS